MPLTRHSLRHGATRVLGLIARRVDDRHGLPMDLALDQPVVRDEHDTIPCIDSRVAVSNHRGIARGDRRGSRVDRDASVAGHVDDDVALVRLLSGRFGAVLRDDDLRRLVGRGGDARDGEDRDDADENDTELLEHLIAPPPQCGLVCQDRSQL